MDELLAEEFNDDPCPVLTPAPRPSERGGQVGRLPESFSQARKSSRVAHQRAIPKVPKAPCLWPRSGTYGVMSLRWRQASPSVGIGATPRDGTTHRPLELAHPWFSREPSSFGCSTCRSWSPSCAPVEIQLRGMSASPPRQVSMIESWNQGSWKSAWSKAMICN